MKIIIHRGTHEIGGSCMELASLTGNTRIAVDLGMPLVNSDKTPFEWKTYRHLTVAELTAGKILPNVSGLYNADETPISAIILSHAHLDHYGFLRFASKDIPVFMSTGAKSLAEVSNIFLDTRINFEKVNTFSMWQPFRVGEFTITPYLVDHSAPDAAAFLIEGDGQRIFYSGDFRGHGRKKVLLENIIKTPPQNIDYLVMEGSMLGREEGRFPDEDEVERGIYAILLNKKTPCYIFTSSQNLDRLVSIFRAARQSGRTLVIDLYTAFVLDKLSSISPKVPQFNWQGIRVLYSRYHANKLAGQDKQLLYKYRCSKIELEEILNQPQDKVLLVKDSRYFRILAGKISKATTACAVYSMWSGYLERSDLRQFLHDHNIEMTEVHTSGHAYIGQLKSLAAALQPRFIIPMHTFYPGKYAELFDNVIQLKDGETMDLDTSRKANLNKGRALSRVFIETLSPEKAGLYGPLVELVRKNKDLHLEFQGQLNLDNPNSDTPKDESIIIYYKGNGVLKLSRSGKVTIASAFTSNLDIPSYLRTEADVATYINALPTIMFNVATHGKSSMEIEYEQMIIRANNLERRINSEYIAVYNQYTINGKRWDILAVKWPRLGRQQKTLSLALIEVKYALNPDIKTAYAQLERYYTDLGNNMDHLCRDMELILKQKLELKLIEKTPEQAKQLNRIGLESNIKTAEIILFLVDYNPNSIWKKQMIEKARELPFANQIKIIDGGLAIWEQGLKPLD